MLPFWAIASAWAVTWGVQRMLAYHEIDEKEEKDKSFTKGSTTVAKEGASLNLVFGTCRVNETNIFAYGDLLDADNGDGPEARGAGTFADYMAWQKFKHDGVFEYEVSCHIGVCAVPQTEFIWVKYRGLWCGEFRITPDTRVAIDDPDITYTTIPNGPRSIYTPNPTNSIAYKWRALWGGVGKGGGVGGGGGRHSHKPANEGAERAGFGSIYYFKGHPDQDESKGSRAVAQGVTGNIANSTAHHGGLPGIAYMALHGMTVGESSTMPAFSPEITVFPDFSTLTPIAIESRINDETHADANPAAALYQILTDGFTGLGLDPSIIDVASFNTAGGILNTEGNGFSMVVSKSVSVKKLIEIVLRQIDGVLYMDPDTLMLTLDLIREADLGVWPYAGLDLYDNDQVLEVASYKLTAWEDTYNQVRLKYEDRGAEYQERFAVMQDTGGSNQTGRIRSKTVSFPGIKEASVANSICARELAFYATPQLIVVLKMNRETISVRPGSVFKWTNAEYGVTDMVLRVIQIDFGTLNDGTVLVNCVRDKFSSIPATFNQPGRPWDDFIGDAIPSPGCMVVEEVPDNPFFGESGSDWNTPITGGLLAVVTYEGGGTGGFLSNLSYQEASSEDLLAEYAPAGQPAEISECAPLGVAYSLIPGSYYDTLTGIEILGVSSESVLRNSTVEEVRAGRSVILLGGEYMAYESYTDLSATTYRSSASTETVANQTDIIITKPAGTVEDDLMVAIINMGTETFGSAPAGWIHVDGSPNENTLGTSDCNMVVMTKVAGGSEPANYTFSRSGSGVMEIQGSIHTFDGTPSIDFVNFQQEYDTHTTGVTTNAFTGGGDTISDFYMTVIGVSGQWYSAGSTISPTDGWTELDDVTSDIDGHLHVQYRSAIEKGDVQVDLNLSGAEAISTHTFVTIGIKGPATSDRTYKLNNVWRGLFDTVPADHAVGKGVVFMSGLDMGRVTTQKSFQCNGGEVVLRVQLEPIQRRVISAIPNLYAAITTIKRDQRPSHPTAFALRDGGPDAVTSGPEFDYAYNEDDRSEIVNASVAGVDENVSSAGIFGDVWANDLRGTWNRRPKITSCASVIVRGDDADVAYSKGERTSLRVEIKGAQDLAWSTLSQEDVQNNPISSNTEFVDMSQAPSGPGSVRLCAFNTAKTNGEELTSRSAEVLTVDVHSSRQLLLNRKFIPYWDVESDSSAAYGSGVVFLGNPVYSARGWRNVTVGAGRPRYKVMSTQLVQGTADEGYAFTGEFIIGEYVTVEQVVAVPYLDTEDSEIHLSWWFMPNRTGDGYSVTIETLDASGAVLDTVTDTVTPATDTKTWQKFPLNLTAISAAARSIRISLGLITSITATGPAISNVSMVMGREIVTDQLGDSDFDALTAWPGAVAAGWTTQTSVGALEPVDSSSTSFVLAPTSGVNSEMSQVVAVPAAFGTGDYVRAQWWTANTDVLDAMALTLTARDSGAGSLGNIITGGAPHPNLDQWYYHEAYLKIPGECVDIHTAFKSIQGAGPMDVCADEIDLSFIKGEARAVELNWKNTQLQLQPATQTVFATAAGSARIVPDHIFPMADGAGVAPVDVVNGVTFDTPVGTVDEDYSFGAPAYGLYDGVDHSSRTALEISSASGGVSCADPTFLDPDHGSFGIYMQYRIVEGDSGGVVSILRKGGDHTSPALGDVTIQLHYDETTHRISLALAYNTTEAGSFAVDAYVAGTVDDVAWHWLYAKVNFTDETIEVFGDTDAGTSTSITAMIAAIEGAGQLFKNETDLVEIGVNSDLNANDNPMQISYMAILRGIPSELFQRSHGQAIWVHGSCQNIVDTGYAIDYVRTSRAAYPIEADKVAMWSGSAGGGDVQVPLEFNENWGGTDFLSLGCHPATENLAGYANDLSQWTASSAIIPTVKLISERGLREMQVVDATSNGGYYYRDFTGLTNGVTYRVSVFARAETGDHVATVEATEDDLSSVAGSVAPTVTITRGRYTFTFTAVGTQTRIKLYGGTAGTQTNTGYHGIMLTEGTAYGPVIYNDINQDGTTETLAVQTQSLTATGNELTSPDEGSIYAAYIQSVVDTGAARSVCEIYGASGSNDRRVMRILSDGTQESEAYTGVGATYHTTGTHVALTADSEYNRSTKWRRKANLASGAYTLEDDITAPGPLTESAVGTANTEGAGGHTRIFIACQSDLSGQLSGLQTLRLYTGEVRDFDITPATVTPISSMFTSDPGTSGGITAHGALTGRDDPEGHAQYLLIDGTRPMTGVLPSVGIETVSGGGSDPLMIAGTADPSAAAGVAAPEGSIYKRFVAGAGEIWVKTGVANIAWVQLSTGALTLEVADITDPSAELNVVAGAKQGEFILCYQALAASDIWTTYAWDSSDSLAEQVPYRVTGSTGMWSAVAGRYNNNGIDTPGEMIVFAGSNKAVMLGESVLENTSTGLYRFDGLSIGLPTTDIDIGAGKGHILNSHTDPNNPTHADVEWSSTSLTISDLTDGVITWVYMDSAGVAQQQTTMPSPIELRENIHLGFLIVFGGAIINFISAPYVISNPAMQLAGLFDAIGTINLSVSISNGGSGLTLSNSGGVLISRGGNFDGTEAGRAAPNDVDITSANPQEFRYGNQSTFDPAFVTLVDPLTYDVAGVNTLIPGSGNRATNQRIWIAPDGSWAIQFGTVWYPSLTQAITGVATEAFVDHPTIAQNKAVLVATISIRKGATDLSDPTHVRFLTASKFGEPSIGGAGQSVTSIQQAYNNSLDGTIQTDTTRTAVKFQRGTAVDTDDVLEVLNGAGDQVLGITGEGAITAGTIQTTGLIMGGQTASDILVAADSVSTSDLALTTAGYVDARYHRTTVDHGTIGGLGDDDHTHYHLTDGTRPMTGALVVTPDGTAALPAVQVGGEGNGLFSSSTNVLDIAAGGTAKFRFASFSMRAMQTGSEGAPVWSHATYSTTGPFFVAPDAYAISTAGTQAVRWDANQNQINVGGITAGTLLPITGDAHFLGSLVNEWAFAWLARGASIRERTAAPFAHTAARGQIWVKNSSPNVLMFQNDTDIDVQLLTGIALNTSGVFTDDIERQRWSANTTGLPVSTITRDAIAEEALLDDLDVAGLSLTNNTASTASVDQFSPALVFQYQGWDGESDKQLSWSIQGTTEGDGGLGYLSFGGAVAGYDTPAGSFQDVFRIVREFGEATGHVEVRQAVSTEIGYGFIGSDTGMAYNDTASGLTLRLAATDKLSLRIANAQFNGFAQSSTVPHLSLGGSGGLGEPATNNINVITAGTQAVEWDASQNQINAGDITAAGTIQTSNTDGPAMLAEAATPTNPTLIPDRAHFTTGVSSTTTTIYLVTGSNQSLTLTSNTLWLKANTPSLSSVAIARLSDKDTGAYWPLADTFANVTGGVERQRWSANTSGLPVSTIFRDDVGVVEAGETVGLRLANTTDAAAAAQQWSPMFEFEGQGWKEPPTSATQEVLFAMQLETVQGTVNPSGNLVWKSNINDAGYVDRMMLNSAGDLTITGDVDAAGGMRRTFSPMHIDGTSTSTTYDLESGGKTGTFGLQVVFAAARSGSVVELAVWVGADLTAGQVDFWVQKSTDGGDAFVDLWGSSGTPVATLDSATNPENTSAMVAKDTNTFAKDDLLRIRAATNGSFAPLTEIYAQLTVEC